MSIDPFANPAAAIIRRAERRGRLDMPVAIARHSRSLLGTYGERHQRAERDRRRSAAMNRETDAIIAWTEPRRPTRQDFHLCRLHADCRPRPDDTEAQARTRAALSHACWLTLGRASGDARPMRERAHRWFGGATAEKERQRREQEEEDREQDDAYSSYYAAATEWMR